MIAQKACGGDGAGFKDHLVSRTVWFGHQRSKYFFGRERASKLRLARKSGLRCLREASRSFESRQELKVVQLKRINSSAWRQIPRLLIFFATSVISSISFRVRYSTNTCHVTRAHLPFHPPALSRISFMVHNTLHELAPDLQRTCLHQCFEYAEIPDSSYRIKENRSLRLRVCDNILPIMVTRQTNYQVYQIFCNYYVK